MTKWTIDEAREHYNINGWGAGYFDINPKGTSKWAHIDPLEVV